MKRTNHSPVDCEHTGHSACNCEDEKQGVGICTKVCSGASGNQVFRQLLAASKDAEFLIAYMFERIYYGAAPLEDVWDKLAVAIEAAQQSLQAQHYGRLSMEIFHEIMNGFYAVLMLGAIGIGFWFYRKKKESDR